MKPPPFRYHAPSSVGEALNLLGELPDAKVLAGGQSLMPLLNMRLMRPAHLVDINSLGELSYVRETDEGGLAIGALTRHRALEHSGPVAARAPLIAEAIGLVGDRQIRVRGTLGGSLVHADPAAELPTIALALDADLIVEGRAGARSVRATEFFRTFLTTAVEPDELLVEVQLPPLPARTGCAFLELARQRGAFAIVAVAATVTLEGERIREARLALGGVGPTPIRAHRSERVLQGARPSRDLFAEAGRLAAEDTDPTGDVHGSEAYRREMAAVFTRRALEAAASRAA